MTIMARARAIRPMNWLLGTHTQASPALAALLTSGLFSSVPIFLGGVLNTSAVAALAMSRHPTAAFTSWLVFEIVLGLTRFAVLLFGKRAIRRGAPPPNALAAVLSCVWAASLGFGTFLCITSGDWVLAAIACLSAAAMVCGMCLRNFGTPRLAAAMVILALTPCAVAGLLTTEPVMPIISVQLPIFLVTILSAAFSLHRMLVSWMTALNDLERSRSLNETILQSSPDYTLILEADGSIAFCKRPGADAREDDTLIGRTWVSLLPASDRPAGRRALERAAGGEPAALVTSGPAEGEKRWFDNIINRTSDGSGRLIVVSRDITHQKVSEERAVWMAQHDALTGLPNRTVLQERLDAMLERGVLATSGAMLIVDVDNFKTVNDSLGHDTGDALLCAVAEKLVASVADGDLVARTGGDEFALLVAARRDADVEAIAARIIASLREPISHLGRPVDCSVSIGASLIPRDGVSRTQIMKAADLALYAAKSNGRGQLRIFAPVMMEEAERHQSMLASARVALQRNAIVPYYQPKVCLRSEKIVGFEALLRWRDHGGQLRGPDAIEAAFDAPVLGPLLSERMFEAVLDDIEAWNAADIAFGHVAVNVTGADFRQGDLVEMIAARLARRKLEPSVIQIEVTENVFLGRGAQDVEQALRHLSALGVRIALDDFGTGYASLSHLNQFPVDLLKIDRSFIQRIGCSADADAICSTLVSLGHSLDLEIVAEGIETPTQEVLLMQMGCDTGQGFLYSPALPAAEVTMAILRQSEGDAMLA